MKKIIAIIIAITALCSIASAELYPETACVVKVNYEEDIVTVETFNGFLFTFNGCESYCEGDCVSLIMEDNSTELVYDDEIVKVQYNAWTLINWYKGE